MLHGISMPDLAVFSGQLAPLKHGGNYDISGCFGLNREIGPGPTSMIILM